MGLLEIQDGLRMALYKNIVKFFEEHNTSYKQNMIGFAADGANVMAGKHNSVASMFKKGIPHLFIMSCIFYSLALYVSNAGHQIPDKVEELMREHTANLKYSSKHLAHFHSVQEILKVPFHKILKMSAT